MATFTYREKQEQVARLRPLFAYLRDRGIGDIWLARRLWPDVERAGARLWTYKHGSARMPANLIERACRELGIPVSWVDSARPVAPQSRRAVRSA